MSCLFLIFIAGRSYFNISCVFLTIIDMLIHLQLDIIIFDQDVLNQQLQSKSMHAVSNVTTV